MPTLLPYDPVRPEGTIRYWSGGITGPAVVLPHGATLDHRAWAPQADLLAMGSWWGVTPRASAGLPRVDRGAA